MAAIVLAKTLNPKMKKNKLCKIAGIPRSSFYYSDKAAEKKTEDEKICRRILRMPKKVLCTYGAKRKSQWFKQKTDLICNHKKMSRILSEFGITTHNRLRKYPKDYYKTLKENRRNLPANILDRDFSASRPLEKAATDISYFRVREGWLFLSPVMDLYNNEILRHRCSMKNDENLVQDTLNSLIKNYDVKNMMLHSDQGTTYTAKEYRKKLIENGIVQSMSRRGNCWDNACMEHFFGTLKVETGYYRTLRNGLLSYNQMKYLIDDFIDFYNNERIQKKLNYCSPVKFRSQGAA
ncbi:MAG: IS3 family transposase [Treponema sp.]